VKTLVLPGRQEFSNAFYPENGSSQNTEQRGNREIMMLQKQMA
jgi:hypothetical protein